MSEIDQALTQSLIDLSEEHDARLRGLEQSLSELLKSASKRSDQDDTLSQQLQQLADQLSQLAEYVEAQDEKLHIVNENSIKLNQRLKALEART